MNCIICDDNCNLTTQVNKFVQSYAHDKRIVIECTIYNNSIDLLQDLKAGLIADLYLLDIIMPGIDGIHIAKHIRKVNSESVIVFLTSTLEYTCDAYEVDALQYLNKPLTKEKFYKSLDRTLKYLHIDSKNLLPITTKNGLQVLLMNEIIYIESNKHILNIYLTSGAWIETKDSSHTITELSSTLPCPPFIIPYKGYIVNLTHVSHIEKYYFITINGSKIPIPSRQYSNIKEQFSDFLLQELNKNKIF